MRFLLDTHLLLWLLAEPGRVPAPVRQLISGARSEAYFSLASIWEVAIKRSIGRLGIGARTVADHLEDHGFRRLDLRVEHLDALESLPWLHRDPFDRMLVAQSRVEPMTLLTVDRRLAAYGTTVRVV
ncbi:MAG: type II toxin-antitoxin system VapC family toxin [Planctomycetaceae bacterium]|nr:MAG: type II toxin-antitoxin system VapC family toxin [Planctomycetaceae bacterium]